MNTKRTRPGLGETTRRLLNEAAGPGEPDVSHLVATVPEIMAEARRRRASLSYVDPVAAVVPVARKAIPRLAAAAAVLVLMASFLAFRDARASDDMRTGLDSLILTGETDGADSDLLLEAIVGEEHDDG